MVFKNKMDYNLAMSLMDYFVPISITLIIFYLVGKTIHWLFKDDIKIDFTNREWWKGTDTFYSPEDLPPEYLNSWLPIARSSEVKPNCLTPVHAFGKDLVIFRNSSGKAYVLDAYCPHMGTYLPVGGKVVNDTVRCPFHGWTFNGDGDCILVPGLGDTNLPKVKIQTYKFLEMNGLIMVWFNAENDPPTWKPTRLSEIETLDYVSKLEMTVRGHFTDVAANSVDVAHFPIIHRAPFMANAMSVLRADSWSLFWSKLLSFEYEHIFETLPEPNQHQCKLMTGNIICILGYPLLKTIGAHIFDGPYMSYWTLDSTFLTKIRILLVAVHAPLPNGKFLFSFHTYTSPGLIPKIMTKVFYQLLLFAVERDAIIWTNKKYLKRPVLAKTDKFMAKYYRWLNQFCGQQNKIEI